MVDIFVHPESPFSVETYNFFREIETILCEEDELDILNYYDAHKLEFKTYLEKPLEEIANHVSNQLFLEIEVDKECILDDVYLENYQFYFYLYPHKQESENTEINTCLFMNFPGEHINNNYPALNIGIYVNGTSPDKKRFLDNYQGKFATKVPEIILQHTYLSEKSSLFDSWLSSKKLHPFNRLGDWFNILSRKNSSIKDIKIIDNLPLEELLRYSHKQLIEQITLKFEGIFPLLLLAISNNILSDINSYLEYRYNKYPHLFNPFNLFNIDLNSENNKVIQASKEKQNQPEYTLSQCSQETNFTETQLTQWIRAINRKKQAIFQGPPGTGKTFLAQKLAQHLITGGDGFWELIQFHPAYTYEDFIQGIRPQSEDGKLTYPVVSGRFLKFCQKAALCQNTCVLIIDEINRANLSQVFGELMYLLEYRDAKIPLAGSGELFSIPENVRIIGTMNTADRSIALVDHALRRRFAFITLSPNYEILRQYHKEIETNFSVEGLIQVLEKINQEINDPNYQVGISFFLRKNIVEEIQDIWQIEIEPYLEEYFFAQPGKVDDFRWDKIKHRTSESKN